MQAENLQRSENTVNRLQLDVAVAKLESGEINQRLGENYPHNIIQGILNNIIAKITRERNNLNMGSSPQDRLNLAYADNPISSAIIQMAADILGAGDPDPHLERSDQDRRTGAETARSTFRILQLAEPIVDFEQIKWVPAIEEYTNKDKRPTTLGEKVLNHEESMQILVLLKNPPVRNGP